VVVVVVVEVAVDVVVEVVVVVVIVIVEVVVVVKVVTELVVVEVMVGGRGGCGRGGSRSRPKTGRYNLITRKRGPAIRHAELTVI